MGRYRVHGFQPLGGNLHPVLAQLILQIVIHGIEDSTNYGTSQVLDIDDLRIFVSDVDDIVNTGAQDLCSGAGHQETRNDWRDAVNERSTCPSVPGWRWTNARA